MGMVPRFTPKEQAAKERKEGKNRNMEKNLTITVTPNKKGASAPRIRR
jgi:hypothetical protein